ncbi:MAG: glycerol-3-phosphate 1-O-acyltransferase PlsY [Myxococcota bacterium]
MLAAPPPIVLGLAYLLGSIPFGAIIAKRRGIDIQETGSGNIGATNVARTLGKKTGAVVLLLDAAKGAAAVALAHAAGTPDPGWLPMASGFAAVVGHCFPVWLRFHGGKGVATSLGVFVVIEPLACAVSTGIFALVYGVFRIAAVGSLVAAAAFPLVLAAMGHPRAGVLFAALLGVVILIRHRDNLQRLAAGTENKV